MIHHAALWAIAAAGKAVAAITHAAVTHTATQTGHVVATQATTHSVATQAAAAVQTVSQVNPELAMELAIAKAAIAHPVVTGLIGAGALSAAVASIAYGDLKEFKKQLDAAPGESAVHAMKVSLAGKLVNDEFVPATGPFHQGIDEVLLAELDEDKKEITKKVVVRAQRVQLELAAALGGGNIVVLG